MTLMCSVLARRLLDNIKVVRTHPLTGNKVFLPRPNHRAHSGEEKENSAIRVDDGIISGQLGSIQKF